MNRYKHFVTALYCSIILVMAGCAEEATTLEDNPTGVVEDIKEAVTEAQVTETETVEKDSVDTEPEEASGTEITEKQETPSEAATGPLGELAVHFIDVGQADSTLLTYSHEGEDFTILIDAGNWNSSSALNYLTAQNIDSIDILVGTHPDADHIGQIDKIINAMDVEEVWLSGNTSDSQVFSRMLDAIEAKDVGYHEPRAGEVYDVGPLLVEVLNPTGITGDIQDESISLRMTYGSKTFLFTGDTEEEGERQLLKSGQDLSADIFQMGHHGSSTSNTQAFLNAVNPSIAIISAGEDNQYGHPHDEVVNRVKEKGIDLYSTSVHGTIIIKTNGEKVDITTKQDGNVTPSSKNGVSTAPKKDTSTNTETKPKAPDSNAAGCININTASLEQIQEIIHFGPSRAEELIQIRPFSSVEDLERVKGIAASRLNDIISQGLACVGG